MRETVTVTDFMEGRTVTAAIQAAFDEVAENGTLIFPKGDYTLIGEIRVTRAGITVRGTGATLRATTRFQSFLNLSGTTNILVEGLNFDLGKSALVTYTSSDYPNFYNVGIHADGFNGMTLRGCHFSNLYTAAVSFKNGSGPVIVSGCTFESPAQAQMLKMEHILIQSCAAHFEITDNRMTNVLPADPSVGPCGLFLSGLTGSLKFERNHLYGCGRDNSGAHRLGALDIYGNAKNVRIVDNVFAACMAEVLRLNTTSDCWVVDNRIAMAARAERGRAMIAVESTAQYAGVGQIGCDNFWIEGNTFDDPSHCAATCITLSAYDWGSPLVSITVRGNKQNSGNEFLRLSGPFENVQVDRNRTVGRGNITVLPAPGGVVMGTTAGTEIDATYERLTISGNSITDTSNSGANAINIALNTATTASVGSINILGNRAIAKPRSPAAAISVQLKAAAQAKTSGSIERNDLSGYATVVSLIDIGDVSLVDNRAAPGFTTFLINSNARVRTSRRHPTSAN